MKDISLVRQAKRARDFSYCPYSHYSVGAAILTESGDTYLGANIENQVNDLSICAERVALFKAVSNGEKKFSKIAVVCEGSFCSPCGACRQTLLEFAPDLEVLMGDREGSYRRKNLADLLPEPFDCQ